MQFLNTSSCVMYIKRNHNLLVSKVLEVKLTMASEERMKVNVSRQIKNLKVSLAFNLKQ